MVFHTRSTQRRERRHCGRGRPIVLSALLQRQASGRYSAWLQSISTSEAILAAAVPADKLEIVLSSSSQSFLQWLLY